LTNISDVVIYVALAQLYAGGAMPTRDMSGKIGKSPSPSIQRVITNNTNVQQPAKSVPAALASKFTKKPVSY
jgi:hypothetical protein